MSQDTTIILHTFIDILEATLAQNILKENGIASFLENENVVGLNPFGGIELKIFSKDKEKSELLLAEQK